MILKNIILFPDSDEYWKRQEEVGLVREQTPFICKYLELNLKNLKFNTSGFNIVNFSGASSPKKVHTLLQSLVVPVKFDLTECLATPLEERTEYYLALIESGLRRVEDASLLPKDLMLGWLDDFRRAGCKTVWTHKERTFREHGIKCQLNAELSINGFDLHLNIYKKNTLIFSKIIHSGSSSIFIYPYFLGDVKLSADSIMVCDKLGKLIFYLPLSSI